MPPDALFEAREKIVTCNRCERLRSYCRRVAVEKRASFASDVYWGKPVPGFGDPDARIVLIGLAPAAHGANRTGRVFTGDGNGGSGDFLMTALHAVGLANQTFSRSADDGLRLTDVWIAAAVRCAPPDNKPTPGEIDTCFDHLTAEIDALSNARVFVPLGRIAFDVSRRLVEDRGGPVVTRTPFSHGAHYRANGCDVIASYHPSRQNTHTGRLTQAMLRAVLRKAQRLVGEAPPGSSR